MTAKTEFFVQIKETVEGGHSRTKTFGFVEFLTNMYSTSFDESIETDHDLFAKYGQKIKAIADKNPFTITLPSYAKGEKQRDIDIKFDTRENDITVRALDGLNINGLEEVVFSGKREKASFEYDHKSKSWIIW